MVSAVGAPILPLFIELFTCNLTMLAVKPGRCLADTPTLEEKVEKDVGGTFPTTLMYSVHI